MHQKRVRSSTAARRWLERIAEARRSGRIRRLSLLLSAIAMAAIIAWSLHANPIALDERALWPLATVALACVPAGIALNAITFMLMAKLKKLI